MPAIPARGGPGRTGASAAVIRATSASSIPHRRVSPSTWTAIRPNAGSATSLVAAIPGLKPASRSQAASRASRSASGARSRKVASGASRWALPSGIPRRTPSARASGSASTTVPSVQGCPPRTIGPGGHEPEVPSGDGVSILARARRRGRWGQSRCSRRMGIGRCVGAFRWGRRRLGRRGRCRPAGRRVPGGAAGVASPSRRSARAQAGVPGAALRVEDLEGRAAARRPVAVAGHRPRRSAAPRRPGPAGSSRSGGAPGAGRSPPRPRPRGARPRLAGSSTTSSVPARRASAASRPRRSPTRFPATAGSRPSGRSTTSRSTVRAASSAPARASASSRSTGAGPRATPGGRRGRRPPRDRRRGRGPATRRSPRRPAPPRRSAARRVVRPEDAAPRSATVASRGRPPGRGSRPAPRTRWGRCGRPRPRLGSRAGA